MPADAAALPVLSRVGPEAPHRRLRDPRAAWRRRPEGGGLRISDPDIHGTWRGHYAEATLTFSFRSDGTFTQSYSGHPGLAARSIEGTWEQDGDGYLIKPFLDVWPKFSKDTTGSTRWVREYQLRESRTLYIAPTALLFASWALMDDPLEYNFELKHQE
jgi:hypothetical protein